MNRIPVTSHNIYSIGYDSNSKVLEIEFDTYAIYRYYEVPEDVYEKLMLQSQRDRFFIKKSKECIGMNRLILDMLKNYSLK